MLPVEVSEPSEEKSSREILMNYEPNEQEALNQIIPKYVTSLFYGALVEAVASEKRCPHAGHGFRNKQCGRDDRGSFPEI